MLLQSSNHCCCRDPYKVCAEFNAMVLQSSMQWCCWFLCTVVAEFHAMLMQSSQCLSIADNRIKASYINTANVCGTARVKYSHSTVQSQCYKANVCCPARVKNSHSPVQYAKQPMCAASVCYKTNVHVLRRKSQMQPLYSSVTMLHSFAAVPNNIAYTAYAVLKFQGFQ